MRIQVVSEYYFPDNFRINDIVSELVRKGIEVDVLTALPDYSTGKIPQKYRKFKNRKEEIFGANTVRIHTTERRSGVLRRVLNYSSFMINSFFYSAFCKKPNCDAIFVYETSPIFQALPAIVYKKRTKKKLVLYCCDLWPESLKAWNVNESSIVFKVIKAYSGWLYRQCDNVAISSRPFKQYLIDVCGVDPEKIVYLPQHAEDTYADIACQFDNNECIDFLFAGNIGAVQNVDCIIKAIPYIKTNKRFCIHIVGDGSELNNLIMLSEKLKINDKIIFHGRHPLDKMKEFYKKADYFLLTLRGGDSIGMTLPAKSQGYLCAGKPIIAAIDGAGNEMIKEADCGQAVSAGDFVGLGNLMTEAIENFESYKLKGENGREFYKKNYTKDIYINKLLKLLTE